MYKILFLQPFIIFMSVQLCKPISRDNLKEIRRSLNYSPSDELQMMKGHEASLYEYTFMAVLAKYGQHKWRGANGTKKSKPTDDATDPRLICGGAIIHKDWVLTVARCFDSKADVQQFQVYAGVINLNSEAGWQIRPVSHVAKHPQYEPSSDGYNIAMIKVASSFTITTYVRAGYLPSSPLQITGMERCHMLAFTRDMLTEDNEIMNEKHQDRLVKLQLHAISYREYLDRLKILKARPRYTLTKTNFGLIQILNNPQYDSQGACDGDMGDPCICEFKIQGLIGHHTKKNMLWNWVSNYGGRCRISS